MGDKVIQVHQVFTMEVSWEHGDKIPVTMNDRVVGMVTNVEPQYVLDGVLHSKITFLIEENAWRAASFGAALDTIPPFRVFFPRPLDEINIDFIIS
jgi:hypothetical protein